MIRVLVVDDHAIVRLGLRQLLASAADITMAGEAGDAREALALLTASRYDVALVDLSLPDVRGLDLLDAIMAGPHPPAVLVLSVHAEKQYALRALRAGASGYLTKDSPPEVVLAAVREVGAGQRHVSEALADRLSRAPALGTRADHELLSNREMEVLVLLAQGRSPTSIAAQLELSVKTVSTHRTRILSKLGLESTADLIRYAIDAGLVP